MLWSSVRIIGKHLIIPTFWGRFVGLFLGLIEIKLGINILSEVDKLIKGWFRDLNGRHHGIKLLIVTSSCMVALWALSEIHIILFIYLILKKCNNYKSCSLASANAPSSTPKHWLQLVLIFRIITSLKISIKSF